MSADAEFDEGGNPRLGPETRGVCKAAIEHAKHYSGSFLVATAGFDPERRIVTSDMIRDYLVRSGVPDACIKTRVAEEWNTVGELTELVELLYERVVRQDNAVNLDIVVRHWHRPRVRLFLFLLLWRFLGLHWLRNRLFVTMVPAPSDSRDWIGEPLRFVGSFFQFLRVLREA